MVWEWFGNASGNGLGMPWIALYREANENVSSVCVCVCLCVQTSQKEGQLETECVFNKTNIPWIPSQSKEEVAKAFKFSFLFFSFLFQTLVNTLAHYSLHI